jgi:hypothetical protein
MNQDKKSKKKIEKTIDAPLYEISLKFSNNLLQAYLFEIFENMNINLSPIEMKNDGIEFTDLIKIKFNNELYYIHFFDKSKMSNVELHMNETFKIIDTIIKFTKSKNIVVIFFQIPQNFEFENSAKDNLIFFFQVELKIKVVEFSTNNDLLEYLSNLSDSITTKEEKSKITFFETKPVTSTNLSDIENITNELSKMFIKHLMCIPGISEKKAISIVKIYPTLKSLMEIYHSNEYNEKEKENFLADVQIEDKSKNSSKKLGIALSAKVYKCFYSADPVTIIN